MAWHAKEIAEINGFELWQECRTQRNRNRNIRGLTCFPFPEKKHKFLVVNWLPSIWDGPNQTKTKRLMLSCLIVVLCFASWLAFWSHFGVLMQRMTSRSFVFSLNLKLKSRTTHVVQERREMHRWVPFNPNTWIIRIHGKFEKKNRSMCSFLPCVENLSLNWKFSKTKGVLLVFVFVFWIKREVPVFQKISLQTSWCTNITGPFRAVLQRSDHFSKLALKPWPRRPQFLTNLNVSFVTVSCNRSPSVV